MKLFNIKLIITSILIINIHADETLDSYQIELLIFKHNNNNESEVFTDQFIKPEGEHIGFRDVDLYMNKGSFDIKQTNNFFQQLLSNISINKKKSIETKSPRITTNPRKWFRKSDNLEKLKKFKSKLETSGDFIFLDSMSWQQNIPYKDESKYLTFNNGDYGFYLNLYRNRYLHADLKSYLGFVDKKNNNLDLNTDKYIEELDAKTFSESNNNDIDLDINLSLNKNNEFVEITSTPNRKQNSETISQNKSEALIYFIDEDRRLFNEEIHYFDHPMFGVLISISKIN
jgi:hypothetical protein